MMRKGIFKETRWKRTPEKTCTVKRDESNHFKSTVSIWEIQRWSDLHQIRWKSAKRRSGCDGRTREWRQCRWWTDECSCDLEAKQKLWHVLSNFSVHWRTKSGKSEEDEMDGPFKCLQCGYWAHPDGEAAWVDGHKQLGRHRRQSPLETPCHQKFPAVIFRCCDDCAWRIYGEEQEKAPVEKDNIFMSKLFDQCESSEDKLLAGITSCCLQQWRSRRSRSVPLSWEDVTCSQECDNKCQWSLPSTQLWSIAFCFSCFLFWLLLPFLIVSFFRSCPAWHDFPVAQEWLASQMATCKAGRLRLHAALLEQLPLDIVEQKVWNISPFSISMTILHFIFVGCFQWSEKLDLVSMYICTHLPPKLHFSGPFCHCHFSPLTFSPAILVFVWTFSYTWPCRFLTSFLRHPSLFFLCIAWKFMYLFPFVPL